MNIHSAQDKAASFLLKLQLYQRRVQVDDVSMFSQLTKLLEGTEENCPFAGDIMQHLHSTEESISGYFPDLEHREKNTWIARPFSLKEGIIKDDDVTAEREFLGLREDNTLKADFQESGLGTFWHEAGTGHPNPSDRALKVLILIIVTAYHRDAGFSSGHDKNQGKE